MEMVINIEYFPAAGPQRHLDIMEEESGRVHSPRPRRWKDHLSLMGLTLTGQGKARPWASARSSSVSALAVAGHIRSRSDLFARSVGRLLGERAECNVSEVSARRVWLSPAGAVSTRGTWSVSRSARGLLKASAAGSRQMVLDLRIGGKDVRITYRPVLFQSD